MSDLRNFDNDPQIIRVRTEPVPSRDLSGDFESADFGDRQEPLGAFQTFDVEETSGTGRLVGSLAVVLMLGAAAVYGYEVSNNSQPAKPAVTQTAANMPAPAITKPAQSADASQPALSPLADTQAAPAPAAAPAPVNAPAKKAPVRGTRSLASAGTITPDNSAAGNAASSASAASSGTPEQSAAVQPVYPTAPSSSLATNNNQPIIAPDVQEPAQPDAVPAQSAPVPPAPDQAVQPTPAPTPDQSSQPAQ